MERICQAVSTRAARLAAAGIVTIVRKIGKVDKCTVAVDGSLYKLHPDFRFKYVKLQIEHLFIHLKIHVHTHVQLLLCYSKTQYRK